MLRSSTVTRIDRVQPTEMGPAIAELWTTTGEHFPIFDAATFQDAVRALQDQAHVLLSMAYSARTTYVRNVYPIDITAETIPCPDCTLAYAALTQPTTVPAPEPMRREYLSDGVAYFACWRCSRRIYLSPVKAVPVEIPTVARARLNRMVDGLFALDHQNHEATLMQSFPADTAKMPPYQGIHAELEPWEPDFVLTADDLIPYRRISLRPQLTLRLQGSPFLGRDIYKVV